MEDLFDYIRANRSTAKIPWKVKSRYPEYLSGRDLARYAREAGEEAKEAESRLSDSLVECFG